MEPIAIQSCILLFASFFIVSNTANVPVLIWTNYGTTNYEDSLGHTVPASDYDKCLKSVSEKADQIIVILADKLSVDDVTVYTRKQGQKAMEIFRGGKLSDTAFASVSDGYSTTQSLIGSAAEVPMYQLATFNGTKGVVAVDDVASAFGALAEIVPLAQNGNKKMLMIITGKTNGNAVQSQLRRRRAADTGQVAAETSANDTRILISDSKCVLLYIGGIDIVFSNGTGSKTMSVNLTDLSTVSYTATCTNTTMDLTLNFTKPSAVIIQMTFSRSNMAEWFLNTSTATATENEGGKPEKVMLTGAPLPLKRWVVWAPLDFSYHCSEAVTIPRANKTSGSFELVLKRFQLQVFSGNTTTFGPANDCAYFFSAGVWMGLLAGALMLAILSCGVFMVSDIKTMDQFDDVKRTKLLSVPQTD